MSVRPSIRMEQLGSHCVAYAIMWKNNVERSRPQMTIWRMLVAYWIPKATNTDSEYVILFAFPLQQWFTNAPHRDGIRTLPVLLTYKTFHVLFIVYMY
jgi:hypothetical protein